MHVAQRHGKAATFALSPSISGIGIHSTICVHAQYTWCEMGYPFCTLEPRHFHISLHSPYNMRCSQLVSVYDNPQHGIPDCLFSTKTNTTFTHSTNVCSMWYFCYSCAQLSNLVWLLMWQTRERFSSSPNVVYDGCHVWINSVKESCLHHVSIGHADVMVNVGPWVN